MILSLIKFIAASLLFVSTHSSVFSQGIAFDTSDIAMNAKIISYGVSNRDSLQATDENDHIITKVDNSLEVELFENSLYISLLEQQKNNENLSQATKVLRKVKDQITTNALAFDSLHRRISRLELECKMLKRKVNELENEDQIASTMFVDQKQIENSSNILTGQNKNMVFNIIDYVLLGIVVGCGITLFILFKKLKKAWLNAIMIN